MSRALLLADALENGQTFDVGSSGVAYGWQNNDPTQDAADELRRLHETCKNLLQVEAERDAAAKDAERYRWLRLRLEVRELEAMSGGRRPAMQIRIGHSYFDSTHRPGAGYLNPAHFQQECEELDAAIDAAKGEK